MLWIILFSSIASAYCAETPKDIHQYQITKSQIFTRGDTAMVTQRARVLVNYQRLTSKHAMLKSSNSSPSVNLSVNPMFIQYEDLKNRLKVNSFDKANAIPTLASILHQGMNLTQIVDQEYVLSVRAKDKWDALVSPLRKNQHVALEQLLSVFKHPPVVSVPPNVLIGDKIHLNLMPKKTWAVEKITDSSVIASSNSSRQDKYFEFKTFAKVEFDKKTGWLNKLIIIDQKKHLHQTQTTRLIIAPRSLPYVSKMLWLDEPEIDDFEYELFPIDKTAFLHQELDESFSQAMMQLDKGLIVLDTQQSDVTLRYVHGLSHHNYSTSVRYSNIKLFDIKGQLVKLPFWQYSHNGANNFDALVTSEVTLLPLFRDNKQQEAEFKKVDHVTADVSLVPVISAHHSLSWEALLRKPYQYGDAQLSLTLLDKNHYLLKIVNGQTNKIYPELASLKGKMGLPKQPLFGPNWLSTTEESLLRALFLSNSSERIIELILYERPKQLPILQTQQQDHQITKTVTFVSESNYKADPRLAPITKRLDIRQVKNQQLDLFSPKSLAVISNNGHDLTIPIATALTSICTPTIEHGFNDGDTPVKWYLKQINHTDSAYVLTTKDATRRYFYDYTISGKIICQGEPKWRDLPNIPNQSTDHTPWLIDISFWLNTSKLGDMPSKLLYQHLKIWDINGQRLFIRLPKNSNELSVRQALVNGKLLSVSGLPASAKYLTISDKPVTVPYQFNFKPRDQAQ